MALSVDWPNKVINVPKAYTTLVQSTPIEIRELPINQFRLDLKTLEAEAEGAPFVRTHKHNTEVILGGITYARVVEIINDYTVTFEDGSYAVNLIGANSNIGDVLNLNTVSVRSANAAGLISNAAIEFSSFNGGVTVDITTDTTGTVFPTGTPQQPVNNVSDAMLIATRRGLKKLYIVGDITFSAGDDIADMIVYGQNPLQSILTIDSGADVTNTEFFEARIGGDLDGGNIFRDCMIDNITAFSGFFVGCWFLPLKTVVLTGDSAIWDSASAGPLDSTPSIIDMGGTGNSLVVRDTSGPWKIINKTGTDAVCFNNFSGHVTLDSTVTAGSFDLVGEGILINNSIGTATVESHLNSPGAPWDVATADHLEDGSFGRFVGKKLLTLVGYIGWK